VDAKRHQYQENLLLGFAERVGVHYRNPG